MNRRELIILTDAVLITCVVPRGAADAVVRAAQDAGARNAAVSYAHGAGARNRLGTSSLSADAEKEIVHVIDTTAHADRIMEAMVAAGGLAAPGSGFIYVVPLEKAATWVPAAVTRKLPD
jgi:nitrogen regulatory protein PII